MAEKAERFIERAERLIVRLGIESLPPEIAPDREVVTNGLRRLVEQVRTGVLPPRDRRYPELTRLVADQWPLGHELANEVSETEAMYGRL